MPRANANGIEVEYELDGDPEGRPMLLVNGLGGQLVGWSPELLEALAARGFHLIRFDNRDAGLSTWFDDAGVPPMPGADPAAAPPVPTPPAYGLADMADDTAALLEALGIEAAHVLGVSLGGMIAQELTIRHPQRVLSLCSVMSTTGAAGLAPPTPEALAVLMRPPVADREGRIAQAVDTNRVISSPAYPFDDQRELEKCTRAHDRAYHPAGVVRQLHAIVTAGDRTEALGAVTAPTLVVHGADDPLIRVEGGEATAAAVPGSTLLVLPGMGHDMPLALLPQIVDAMVANADRAGDAAGAAA
jgi:pimeloyl-ACP methyl ester carboxylesterase